MSRSPQTGSPSNNYVSITANGLDKNWVIIDFFDHKYINKQVIGFVPR